MKCTELIATALLVSAAMGVTAATGVTAAEETTLEPKAMEVLGKMASYLGSLESFTLKVQDSVDKTDEEGRLLTFHHERTIQVRRPDRTKVSITGDLEKEQILYDGETLTVFLERQDLYAQAKAAPTIEETLDLLRDTYGVQRPLLELLHDNINERLEGKIQDAVYVGLSNVNGKQCHHIALHAVPGIGWQMWIEDDETPVPAKIVVHYADFPGEPRYIMQLEEIIANPSLPDDLFVFAPGPESEKIQFEVPDQVGAEQ